MVNPGRVYSYTILVAQLTGINSSLLSAAGLGALFYVGAFYVQDTLMPQTMHLRVALPANDAAQRQQLAMFGGGTVLADAYMYPSPVRP
ncbi:hypothetical protein T492DRAFT_891143 [Pavlovales sp. CCMP2436]|nr:hypothetical protein T492DRAFT_891143 [Pavlovales sp. CCMP2436]